MTVSKPISRNFARAPSSSQCCCRVKLRSRVATPIWLRRVRDAPFMKVLFLKPINFAVPSCTYIHTHVHYHTHQHLHSCSEKHTRINAILPAKENRGSHTSKQYKTIPKSTFQKLDKAIPSTSGFSFMARSATNRWALTLRKSRAMP